jgi:DNA-binding transcriptional LysR family regulator
MVNHLELKQLEAYVKVYERHSFSKAAEEMLVSQPSISAYINSLEKELQTQLLHRSTKELFPTQAGKMFYEYAKEMLSVRDKSVSALKGLFDNAAGSINVLASSVPAQYILPEILGAFHKTYPNIVFSVEQTDTSDVVDGISAYKGEIGFVGTKIDNPKCVYKDFMSEKLVVITPHEKRFRGIGPSDAARLLRDEYFVIRGVGSGTRQEYTEYLKRAGIGIEDLKISAYFNDTQSIIHAVANGLGLSIVSEIAADRYIRQKMVIPIYMESWPSRYFYIVLKKNSVISSPADAFIKFVLTYQDKYNE